MKWFKYFMIGQVLFKALGKVLEDGKITLSDVPLVVNAVSEAFGLPVDESLIDLDKLFKKDQK
jgi:hypothetical protein